jgi:epsilon-lactone hydrolase
MRKRLIDADGTVRLGDRAIALPTSVSGPAREFLATPQPSSPAPPPLEDKDAWREAIERRNASMAPVFEQMTRAVEGAVNVETMTVANVVVHVATPRRLSDRNRDRALITVHGGGLIYFAGSLARAEAATVAAQWSYPTYGVDYRVPPDHPYPAAVDDVMAVYQHLLGMREPRNIVIAGESAGGNLATAAILKARDHGLPLPGALILNTPQIDLTESGDTFQTLCGIDPVLPGPMPSEIALYADGHDLADPGLSPLFADFTRGFPPTYIQSGTRDIFLSNSVRLHRALRTAGVDADLHVWEGAPHGGFGPAAPETMDALCERQRFVDKHLGAPLLTRTPPTPGSAYPRR